MKDQELLITPATPEPQDTPPVWGQWIVDILKKWLEFNQLPSGIKKKF